MRTDARSEEAHAREGLSIALERITLRKANFDTVAIEKDGKKRVLDATEFFAISLVERCELLCNDKLTFFRDGKVVPAREAIQRPASVPS